MDAIKKIVREYKLTRRQARQLRKLGDYRAASVQRFAADTFMKCARIVLDSQLAGSTKGNG